MVNFSFIVFYKFKKRRTPIERVTTLIFRSRLKIQTASQSAYLSGLRKAKKTAKRMKMNATTWFQCRLSFWNMRHAITVNTVKEIASWMILSWNNEKGPPLPMKPIRFAGTCAQYSNNATAQLKRMTKINGQ